MANREPKSLFRKLTRLFRSGPVVKRKIRALDTSIAIADKTKSSGTLLFQKSLSPTYATITSNAYNLSERLMRYQDFQEMEYSVDGATRIAQLDGFKTIAELAEECSADPDKTFVVYSYDHDKKKIVPALGKQARQTCVDHAWKVTFDNGKEIIASSEHRLMLRDGTYSKVEDLQPGDAMMPFYRKDLFAGAEKGTKGYSWVYTMDDKFRGWTKEHQLVAEWVAGRALTEDECVHHINFTKTDNRPENLKIMSKSDHDSYHAMLNNDMKWAPENHEWIEKFKKNHATWMRANAPTRRHDVTFAKIVQVGEKVGFDIGKIASVLDATTFLIHERLVANGFSNFESFVTAYSRGSLPTCTPVKQLKLTRELTLDQIINCMVASDTKRSIAVKLGCTINVLDKFLNRRIGVSWNAVREKCGFETRNNTSGRPKGTGESGITFKHVCDAYTPGVSRIRLAEKLCVSTSVVMRALADAGHQKYSEFASSYQNCKVVSIEYVGVIPLYDLTVDGYKNFATDSVISHNTPEIAAAMDIYADECVAQDEKGRVIHVYSDNEKIRELLEDLFYNVLNVEFNLRSWARNLPVHKDTVIPLLDGRNITIEQLAAEHEAGRENWVYSTQDKTNRMVPGKVAWCGLTRKDSELVRVWLDDGTYVDCTPDHEFTLRDGRSLRADRLVEGTSLMPFYRKVSSRAEGAAMDGYEEVYDASSDRYVYTHRRVAEVLEEGTLKDGRWLVTHHRDFDKRNNDPQNLVRMDEKEHMHAHRQLTIELLRSPDVTAKRMAGIDRWLRSDEHRKVAREQLQKRQAKGEMPTWSTYNSTEQHKKHNVVRSASKNAMWTDSEKRSQASANMSIKFDIRCVDMVVEALAAHGKYVSPKVLGNQLKSDKTFMGHFKGINACTKRDLTKALNSHSGFEGLLNKAGIPSYLELVKSRLPSIASTPWFQRAEKKSQKMSGTVPAMREYKNHKVSKVERLEQTSDVYCMEVLGPNGEHDRHRFMALTNQVNGDGASGNCSGICLENCKYGDFFLYNDVSPDYGVINAFPIPVNEIEREENYDRDDPFAVRYRWVTLGNRTLENWEVTHFRLLGNDMFLPYGSSIIEPARRIWRQLILIEDAMLVYRVVRAPERRVFYIDVANVPPQEVPLYIEQQRQAMRTAPVVDRATGRVDLRYNPMCLSVNTRIKLQDGSSPTLSELIAQWDTGKQDQWVYSVDPKTLKYVPGKVIWAGLTRKNAELVRVTLDDGSYLDVTPDHKFMLRDGSYAKAEDLLVGQSLMPLYTKLSSLDEGDKIKGYEKVYDPKAQKFIYTHRQNLIETLGIESLIGKVVHHTDHNKLNNDPSNLQSMSWADHQKHHVDTIVEYNTSDCGRENSRLRLKKTWNEGKINSSTFVNLWKDQAIRASRINALTLNVGDSLLEHCFRVMDKIGKGLSTKELEFIDAANNDIELQTYIQHLNPDFKNGYCGKFTHSNLQIMLRKVGIDKSLEGLKRIWLLSRYDLQEIKRFCLSTTHCTRSTVLSRFKLGRSSFEELIKLNNEDIRTFAKQYLTGNTRYQRKSVRSSDQPVYLNHKVAKIEKLQHCEDTGCITVEKYHNFAAGPSIECINNLDDQRLLNSWVLVHNSIEEDYFIPVRGGESGTKIDTLAGGQNIAAVEDVAYIQKKLFAALKVPRAYLGYDEMLSSKATLAQEDIRFSRTINVIQKTMLAELNKLAIIHLYAHGYDNEDLQNFVLRLSNPSTVAQQQKLELWRAKFEIAGSAPEGTASKKFIRKEIWGLNEEQIEQIDDERMKEKLIDAAIEASVAAGGGSDSGEENLFGDEEVSGEPEESDEEMPPEENAGEEPEEEKNPGAELLTGGDDRDDDESFSLKLKNINDKPIKAKSQLDRVLYNRGRRRTHGASKTHMPDFAKMTGNDSHSMNDPYDNDWIKSIVSNPFAESVSVSRGAKLSSDMTSTLRRMTSSFKTVDNDSLPKIIIEGRDVQDEIDIRRDSFDLDMIESESFTGNLISENEVLIIDDRDNEDDE